MSPRSPAPLFALAGLLAACSPSLNDGVTTLGGEEDFAAELLPVDQDGPPLYAGFLELGVSGVEQGQPLKLQVRGAYSGDTITFYRGAGYGAGSCPPALQGKCFQMTGTPVAIGTAIANGQGVATLALTGAGPLHAKIYFEAFTTAGTPAASEVQERVIQAPSSNKAYPQGAAFQLASQASVSTDAMLIQPVEVTESAQVVGFGCLSRGVGTKMKAALYTDASGAPGNLVTASGTVTSIVGLTLAPASPMPTVTPGRYWLATIFDDVELQTYGNTLQNVGEYVLLQPYTSPFPATITGATFYQSVRVSCAVGLR